MGVDRRAACRQLLAAGLGAGLGLRAGEALAETTQYSYDQHGRLALVVFSDGTSVQYTYDNAGNRTQVVRGATTPPSTFTQTIQITGTGPVNLRTLADSAGYNGAQNASITYQLASSVTIGGAAGGGVAVDTGTWPYTLYPTALTLQVSGKVYGGGGNGGSGNAGAGTAGGDAVHCRAPIAISVNAGAELKGGGGGSGAGGRGREVIGGEVYVYGGGGGGGGQPNGAGGAGGFGPAANGAPGQPGTSSAPGAGGVGPGPAADGAVGGAFGATGSAGGSTTFQAGGAGGGAGYAVRKNGHPVTVTNNGTLAGAVG